MQKKIYINISACLTISVLLLFALYIYSAGFNTTRQSFIRYFPPHMTSGFRSIDISYNSYYVAGLTSRHIYLGNRTSPTMLFLTDYDLKDTLMTHIRFSEKTEIVWEQTILQVDSPYFYLSEGVSPTLLQGKIADLLVRVRYKPITKAFSAAVALGADRYLLKTYIEAKHQDMLLKESNNGILLNDTPNLEKQVDGKFSTNGQLLYNHQTGQVAYVYYYRNRFLILDTNLNLFYTGRTIDKTDRVQIKLDTIVSGAEMKVSFAAPPFTVNTWSCLSDNFLFILSPLMSTNEREDDFQNNQVIDCYNAADGKYRYSLYLPRINGKKLKSFEVHGTKMAAIYDHYLVTLDLHITPLAVRGS